MNNKVKKKLYLISSFSEISLFLNRLEEADDYKIVIFDNLDVYKFLLELDFSGLNFIELDFLGVDLLEFSNECKLIIDFLELDFLGLDFLELDFLGLDFL